jgi:hypothetical protein
MLIGPAMFYFFVCKTEVYKMIRDRVVKIKESASRALSSSNSTKISSGSVKFWRSRSYQTSSDESPANETSDSKPSNIEAIKYQQNGEDLGEDNLAYTGEDHSA